MQTVLSLRLIDRVLVKSLEETVRGLKRFPKDIQELHHQEALDNLSKEDLTDENLDV